MSKNTNIWIKRLLSSFGVIAIITGFIFTVPSPVVKNALVRGDIQKIQIENNNSLLSSTHVAYAQEEVGEGEESNTDVYGCTDATALNHNPSANTDDGSCKYPVYGCTNFSALNWNSNATHDNGSCRFSPHCDDPLATNNGASAECVYPEGCTDSLALNYQEDAIVDDGSCIYTSYICCDETATNFTPVDQQDYYEVCDDQFACEFADPICCDGNWDSYTPPSERDKNYTCEYEPEVCMCYPPDPFTGEPYRDPRGYAHSACGSGGDTCTVDTNFSITKEGVLISGDATMIKSTPCEEEDIGYLAGVAAAAVSPSTPLNTLFYLDALTTYTVTSKDYCLNVTGEQGSASGYNRDSAGFCCENPNTIETATSTEGVVTKSCALPPPTASCGSATLYPTETAPLGSLCNNGTPSSVTEGPALYSWTCTIPENTASCSVERRCNGLTCIECTALDCGATDQCKYIAGNQTNPSADGLTADVNGYCWNSTNGACGTVHQGIPVSEAPTTNLCVAGFYGQNSVVNSSPTLNGSGDAWEWTCANSNSTVIPPNCTVDYCAAGNCTSNPSADLLNNSFRARPAIVRDANESCTLTWDSSVDSNISEPAQWCRLNGQPVSGSNPDGSNSVVPNSLDIVNPGTSHTLSCYIEGQGIDTESVKCSVRPAYGER